MLKEQVDASIEQLRLADERLKLGAISKSDFLQVKAQLAFEKYTLAGGSKLVCH